MTLLSESNAILNSIYLYFLLIWKFYNILEIKLDNFATLASNLIRGRSSS